ncbi:MAG: radical SAM protein [Candidatus Gracilibacteria bacterium]|nr:radical SAM protein [Candidatus Gracilibacteria bacterium]
MFKETKIRENVTKQNRIWIRISSVCNNNCIFCLDNESRKGYFVEDEIIRKEIQKGFKKGYLNKAIISGGEASINPKFAEYIKFSREVGYDKIQTITNGQKFADLDFCKQVFEAGLNEVTFSIHGHNEALHDYLSGTPGVYKKAIQGILNIKKYFPKTILNMDIVVNKLNVAYLPDIIGHFMKLGIMEFDILQIVPFGNAVINKDKLFYNGDEYIEQFKKTWELGKKPGIFMWTNRFNPEYLEGFEDMIQDPSKIKGDTLGEAYKVYEDMVINGIKPTCYQKNCKVCYMNKYCNNFINTTKPNLKKQKKFIINPYLDIYNSKYFVLKGQKTVSEVYKKFGKNYENFIKKINSLELNSKQEIVNIPLCIRQKNNYLLYENYLDIKESNTLEDYTKKYISDLYRIKSLRCRKCVYNKRCEGLHINFIRAYGFKVLDPIIG